MLDLISSDICAIVTISFILLQSCVFLIFDICFSTEWQYQYVRHCYWFRIDAFIDFFLFLSLVFCSVAIMQIILELCKKSITIWHLFVFDPSLSSFVCIHLWISSFSQRISFDPHQCESIVCWISLLLLLIRNTTTMMLYYLSVEKALQ